MIRKCVSNICQLPYRSFTHQHLALAKISPFGTSSEFNKKNSQLRNSSIKNHDDIKIFSNTLSSGNKDISDLSSPSFFDSKYDQFKTLDGNSKLYFLCIAGVLFMMNGIARYSFTKSNSKQE